MPSGIRVRPLAPGLIRLLTAGLLAIGLAGCGGSESGTPSSGATNAAAAKATVWTPEKALACIEANFPAGLYFTNGFLPGPDLVPPPPAASVEKIRVGMPWVFNDEIAPWFVADEMGYFREVGLEVTLVPGGPGIDPLQLLVSGRIDIAVPAPGALALLAGAGLLRRRRR